MTADAHRPSGPLRSGAAADPGADPDPAANPGLKEHRARARRRLLRLAVFAPPTLLTLSSLSGFLYGMAPKPSANPSVVPGIRPQTKPK